MVGIVLKYANIRYVLIIFSNKPLAPIKNNKTKRLVIEIA